MKNLNLRNQPFSIWETLHFVQVYLGSRLLALGEYNVPGTYSLQIATPDAPSRGHVTLVVTNRHGQVYQDRVAVRYVWRNLEIFVFSIVITTTTTIPYSIGYMITFWHWISHWASWINSGGILWKYCKHVTTRWHWSWHCCGPNHWLHNYTLRATKLLEGYIGFTPSVRPSVPHPVSTL